MGRPRDYSVICDECRKYCHLGQDVGCVCSFGHGHADSIGRIMAANFVFEHLDCNKTGLRLVMSDNVPDEYEDYADEPEPSGN